MNEKQFAELISRYQAGKATPEEAKLIERWLEKRSETDPFGNLSTTDIEETRLRMLKSLSARIEKDSEIPVISPLQGGSRGVAYRIAAAILFIAVAGFALYIYSVKADLPAEALAKAGIKPGGDKAILTLADGSQVELNTIQTPIPQQGVAQITSSNGQLAYSVQSPLTGGDPANAGEGAINTISTPRGGQYQVTLSDGSKVWLNAASSLKFPAAFSGSERIVELTGEAYFEIAHNKEMPFKVMTPDGSEVKVLGTHFNIMAYTEEGVTRTTLLEGSVRVTNSSFGIRNSKLLVPGQRSIINNSTGTLNVELANLEETIAWKNNMFRFDEANVATIMRQVSRWYDVDIKYEEDLSDLYFAAVVSRTEHVTSLLRTMELTGAVHFEIEGKTITVKRGRNPDKK